MLRTVIAAARRQPEPPRLLFASTSEVYAGTLDHGSLPFPTPEDTPLTVAQLAGRAPRTCSPRSTARRCATRPQVPFTIVRPHNVYGPRMGLSHVIPELLQRAHAAARRRRAHVASARPPAHVLLRRRRGRDAVAHRVRPAAAGATLNVGTSAPEVSIGELAAMIAATVGKRLEIVALPATPGSPRRRCPDLARTNRITGDAPARGPRRAVSGAPTIGTGVMSSHRRQGRRRPSDAINARRPEASARAASPPTRHRASGKAGGGTRPAAAPGRAAPAGTPRRRT